MPILYAVIARGTTILCKHAVCPGNFAEVTEQILEKVPAENSRMTYSHAQYLFHYTVDDTIIYMCITDDEFERSRSFGFLSEIQRRFFTTYGARAKTALPYAMNSDFSSVLASEMKAFSQEDRTTKGHQVRPGGYGAIGAGGSRTGQIQSQVEDLKEIMVRNIDTLASRGEKLELLIDRSENLEGSWSQTDCLHTPESSHLCSFHDHLLQIDIGCFFSNEKQKFSQGYVLEKCQNYGLHHCYCDCEFTN